jgi:hypothetical protein
MEKGDYHTARRCFRAFRRATASLVPSIRADLMPRAGYPWSNPDAMGAAQIEFLRVTDLKLPMSSEVSQ